MRTLILLATLALLGACAPPPALPRTTRVAPPPRTWTERDLNAPRGPAVLPPRDSAARRRPAQGYPDDPTKQVFASAVARPPESYRSTTEPGRTLRITEIPAARILAVLSVLDAVPLRTGVWPSAARVEEHDSLGALIATSTVSLASLGSEVVCAGTWPREVPLRMEAYVAVDREAVTVTPRISVSRSAAATADPVCHVGVVGQDRITAFAFDVAAALRQAARMGMAVPIRPRP
ncbi:MAG TPA: hypothetical protein VGB92_11495 [Longimicrobium sp.]|jgi:hypothetical protein